MNKKIKTDAVDSLFDAVLCLQSREECYSFFEDLCTVNELLSLSQRFEVAAMLKDGKTGGTGCLAGRICIPEHCAESG